MHMYFRGVLVRTAKTGRAHRAEDYECPDTIQTVLSSRRAIRVSEPENEMG